MLQYGAYFCSSVSFLSLLVVDLIQILRHAKLEDILGIPSMRVFDLYPSNWCINLIACIMTVFYFVCLLLEPFSGFLSWKYTFQFNFSFATSCLFMALSIISISNKYTILGEILLGGAIITLTLSHCLMVIGQKTMDELYSILWRTALGANIGLVTVILAAELAKQGLQIHILIIAAFFITGVHSVVLREGGAPIVVMLCILSLVVRWGPDSKYEDLGITLALIPPLVWIVNVVLVHFVPRTSIVKLESTVQ